ncbi:MAG: PEP-CTERM sorting domain-containing protein [Phycisphaerae bacterium]
MKFATMTLSLLLAVAAVEASSVEATYFGMENPGRRVVQLRSGNKNYSVWAGKSVFQIQNRNFGGSFDAELDNLPPIFNAYCIDFNQSIYPNTNDTWTLASLVDAPVPGAKMNSTQASMIAYLYGAYSASSYQVELQLAIWEILEETQNSYDIASGDFRARNSSQYDGTVLSGWFSDMASMSFDPADYSGYFALTSETTQDFITEDTFVQPAPDPDDPRQPGQGDVIPEPITFIGGLLGFGAVGRYFRRRRAC